MIFRHEVLKFPLSIDGVMVTVQDALVRFFLIRACETLGEPSKPRASHLPSQCLDQFVNSSIRITFVETIPTFTIKDEAIIISVSSFPHEFSINEQSRAVKRDFVNEGGEWVDLVMRFMLISAPFESRPWMAYSLL